MGRGTDDRHPSGLVRSVEKHESVVQIHIVNPEYAQVQQREKEIADMRAQISTMAAQMQQLMAQLGSPSGAAEPKGRTKQSQ